MSPQDCGQTSAGNGRPGSHELATETTSFSRSLKGSAADDAEVSGACTAIWFKVHGLKISLPTTGPVTKPIRSTCFDAPRTLSTHSSNSPNSSLCCTQGLHAALPDSFCSGVQSLCCLPEVSYHLSQPSRICRSLWFCACATCKQRSDSVQGRPSGFIVWLQVILQSLCASVQLPRNH